MKKRKRKPLQTIIYRNYTITFRTQEQLHKREDRINKKIYNQQLTQWKHDVILRDNSICQYCGQNLLELNDKGKKRTIHPHHIISLDSVLRKFPELLIDVNNGICLCAYCHKFSPNSCHEGGFEFTLWLQVNKPLQYNYLINKIKELNERRENNEQPIITPI